MGGGVGGGGVRTEVGVWVDVTKHQVIVKMQKKNRGGGGGGSR